MRNKNAVVFEHNGVVLKTPDQIQMKKDLTRTYWILEQFNDVLKKTQNNLFEQDSKISRLLKRRTKLLEKELAGINQRIEANKCKYE